MSLSADFSSFPPRLIKRRGWQSCTRMTKARRIHIAACDSIEGRWRPLARSRLTMSRILSTAECLAVFIQAPKPYRPGHIHRYQGPNPRLFAIICHGRDSSSYAVIFPAASPSSMAMSRRFARTYVTCPQRSGYLHAHRKHLGTNDAYPTSQETIAINRSKSSVVQP